MKYMKYLCFILITLSLFLVSCRKEENEAITGDVKENGEVLSADESENIPADDEDETNIESLPEEKTEKQPETGIEELVTSLGCIISEGGEYKSDAERLCEAIVSGDKEIFAQFTGGEKEYYDFLDKVQISSYTLYPFEFTEEKQAEMNENHLYPASQDNYLVEFDVKNSECEEFEDGKNIYCFGLELNPISGSLLSFLIPQNRAEESISVTYGTDYIEHFVDEFSALYPIIGTLYDGRNYANSFDFADGSHLITHLMARSGVYGEPPYTFEEVNGFITESFDGNEGLSLSQMNANGWMAAGVVYPNDDPKRTYGCSWAHGGTSVVYDITEIEKDADREIYTVQIYADYSKIAKACTLVYHFDIHENTLPSLTMVELRDNIGRKMALLSI